MNNQECERLYHEASLGNKIHLNPKEKQELFEWANRNGKLTTDKLAQLQYFYSQKNNECNLPIPNPEIGYPVKGFYEEIYKCLISENELSAAILTAILVEYALKSSVYSITKKSFEYSRTDWGDQKLDEKTFGTLLKNLNGKINQSLYDQLMQFKETRNNLAHANIVKTQKVKIIQANIIKFGGQEENRIVTAAELPSIAWESFTNEIKYSAIKIFIEAHSIVNQLWKEVKEICRKT